MPAESLLHEFPPVTTDEWESAIQRDLKGADYASRLIWHAEEGLDIKPYYRAEDLKGRTVPDAAHYLLARGARATGGWRIREEIDLTDPEEANRAAREAVAAGAEEIAYTRTVLASPSDIALLLANLDGVPVHFEIVDAHSLHLLIDHLHKHAVALFAGFDPFTDLAASAGILANRPPSLAPFVFHTEQYHESGATSAEEVGLTLAAAVDFIAEMQKCGIDANSIAGALTFSFAISPHIFVQIAKLRAFRLVWAQALEAFGVIPEYARARIHARTARWDSTVEDPHTNILRGTTEAISAILGGADSLTVAPFDEGCAEPNEASRRLARNTQLILKHEALLARVADPGGGSYCLEVLTDTIARNAWKRLQKIEANGGSRNSSAAIQLSFMRNSSTSRP